MAEKAAENSGDDVLFGGIDIAGLEESLLTVDVGPDDPVVTETIKEVSKDGGGDPANPDDPPAGEEPGATKEPETKPPDLLEVDKPIAASGEPKEKISDPIDGEDKSGKGKGAAEEIESPIYLHAATLQENGLLPNFDLDELKSLKTDEERFVKINTVIQKNYDEAITEGIEKEKAVIGEALKIYEGIKAGVNPEDLAANASLEEQYGKLEVKDLEDSEENQEAIYADSLFMKGLSEAKVKQLIDVSKNNETLLVDATEGLKEIKGEIKKERDALFAEAEQRKKVKEKRDQETQEKVKTTVGSIKEIIPGVEVTKAEQDTLIKNMTVPVKYTENEQGQQVPVSRVMELRAKDPISFEMRLNYFIEKGFFDKDAKFDPILKKAETSASKKFLQKMSSDKPEVTGKPAAEEDENKGEPKFTFPTNISI